MNHKFAAQLYTLRKELAEDFPTVLRELKAMGWAGVQISGLHGYSAEEIAQVLGETELSTAGMHVPLSRLYNELDTVLEEAKLFQPRDIVCPFLADELRNEEGYRQIRRNLNEIARKIKPLGYRISYHNHAFEFDTMVNGAHALRYLLAPSADNEILAEIDVYWVKKGGSDPLSFIQAYAHRMPIIHLKDMSNDAQQAFAELGTGVIDFAPILRWGEQNGVEWYAVEQDICPGNPMDSLQISYDYINRLALQL
ncbi:MAG: xylose isomerase [Paenibacillus sp. RIFOXYA1_FULL_44_5]|nr:MAG: xylose isomerase [Paenibacillus sp. RIFOXYA1_FULL_44_5]